MIMKSNYFLYIDIILIYFVVMVIYIFPKLVAFVSSPYCFGVVCKIIANLFSGRSDPIIVLSL